MPDRPPATRSERWTISSAYALSWLVIGCVSLGMWIPVHGLGALSIDAAWLATLVPLYRWGSLRLKDLGFRGVSAPRAASFVVATLVVCAWFGAAWDSAVSVRHVASPFAGIGRHSTIVILLVGLSAVISPIAEEVFFRGFLYRCFRNRLPTAHSSVLVGVIFALIHTQYPVAVLPDLAFLGAVLCLVYEYTGSLTPCIAVDLYSTSVASSTISRASGPAT
jgi:membrane protease YdiL (CAAX protease family)